MYTILLLSSVGIKDCKTYTLLQIHNLVRYIMCRAKLADMQKYYNGVGFAFYFPMILLLVSLANEVGFVRKLGMFIFIITLAFIVACGSRQDSCDSHYYGYNETAYENIYDLEGSIFLDVVGIQSQINRSAMPDFGYRFANTVFEDFASPHATFFINQAKIFAGIIPSVDESVMFRTFASQLEDESMLNLKDIYLTMRLIGGYYSQLSDLARLNINNHFDSLFNFYVGAYFNAPQDEANADMGPYAFLYPTYMVVYTSLLLGRDVNHINSFLLEVKETIRYIDVSNALYFLHLSFLMDIEVKPALHDIGNINFPLDNIMSISNISAFVLDYLEFYMLLGRDTSAHSYDVFQTLTSGNEIRRDLMIFDLDVVSFHDTVRALYLTGHDFMHNDLGISSLLRNFDNFLLCNIIYIAPSHTFSDFLSTYHVNAINNILNIEANNNITVYFMNLRDNVIQAENPVLLYYYLRALSKNNSLSIIYSIRQDIIAFLHDYVSYYLDTTTSVNDKVALLNYISKSLRIICNEQSLRIDSEVLHDIYINFERDDIVDTINLIQFSILFHEITDSLELLMNDLSYGLINLYNQSNHEGVIFIKYLAFRTVAGSDFTMADDVVRNTLSVLSNSIHESGLFTGGGINSVACFSSTYQALYLLEAIGANFYERG